MKVIRSSVGGEIKETKYDYGGSIHLALCFWNCCWWCYVCNYYSGGPEYSDKEVFKYHCVELDFNTSLNYIKSLYGNHNTLTETVN